MNLLKRINWVPVGVLLSGWSGWLVVAWLLVGPRVPVGPGPQPPTPATATVTKFVCLIDTTSPTIPQTIVRESDLARAMKLTGKLLQAAITDPIVRDNVEGHNYGPLLATAGGAPALIGLADDGECPIATRLPTDVKSFAALVAKVGKDMPNPLAPSPERYTVLTRGSEMPVKKNAEGVEFIEGEGRQVRYLGMRPDKQLFGSLPKYGENAPVFPRSQWFPLSRANLFDKPDYILDQGQHNSCVGNGWAGALRRERVLWGMADVKLSPAYLYSQINGNQDQGAVISDGMGALEKNGTCPFDVVGQDPVFWRQMTQAAKDAAKDFRVFGGGVGVYRCDTMDEAVSAILSGNVIVFGIMVGRTWNTFDAYGVCGWDAGPGNHCVMADGLTRLPDGRWCLDMVNSWGTSWGPFKNGRAYLTEKHLFGPGVQSDCCAIRLPTRSSKEPHALPKAKIKAGSPASNPYYPLAS